jgi:hypothetical protein
VKREGARPSETVLSYHNITQYHSPEKHDLNFHRRENAFPLLTKVNSSQSSAWRSLQLPALIIIYGAINFQQFSCMSLHKVGAGVAQPI